MCCLDGDFQFFFHKTIGDTWLPTKPLEKLVQKFKITANSVRQYLKAVAPHDLSAKKCVTQCVENFV